jgi:tetratricopeptide (TPR) repeat protein
MRLRSLIIAMLAPLAILLLAIFIYFLPPVHERLSWRLHNVQIEIKRALNPPEQAIFVPKEEQHQIDLIVQETLDALTPSPTPAFTPTIPGPTPSPMPTPTVTPSPTPLPTRVNLTGVVHEYQKFNFCGPANLSMALSYWGWKGTQMDTGAYLRPGKYDKNVMPYEMVNYVQAKTDFHALMRVGGNLILLKQFLAAGFPVILEKGLYWHDDWLGHYALVTGYDDESEQLITQDSLIMPDYPVPYKEIEARWRDFNFVYVVVFPPDREKNVLAILGPQSDVDYNNQYTSDLAAQEASSLTGVDQYFALFNLGSSRVALEDYPGAAEAFDQAFAVYATLQEGERPWRVTWYREEPYAAYYYTDRYQDVIDLANNTFFALGEYTLEESFYWRGLAHEGLGMMNEAIFDLRKAVELNPNYEPPRQALERLGVDN